MYVVGMEEGIFPGTPRHRTTTEEMEEERRLCYVAMTRAKEKLTLTNARQRMLYGRTSALHALPVPGGDPGGEHGVAEQAGAPSDVRLGRFRRWACLCAAAGGCGA